MNNRRGEKMGWVLGWTGGFLWVLLLACIRLVKHDLIGGTIGLALFALGIATTLFFSPWRHPSTQYWKLMLLPYLSLLLALVWLRWLGGGFAAAGLNKWQLPLVLVLLLPLVTAGRRRWSAQTGGKQPDESKRSLKDN